MRIEPGMFIWGFVVMAFFAIEGSSREVKPLERTAVIHLEWANLDDKPVPIMNGNRRTGLFQITFQVIRGQSYTAIGSAADLKDWESWRSGEGVFIAQVVGTENNLPHSLWIVTAHRKKSPW